MATRVAAQVRQTVQVLPTRTPLPTLTPLPTATLLPTRTPLVPEINALLLGCHTDYELASVEVTNAYVAVQNVGEVDINNVTIELQASDEGDEEFDNKDLFIQHVPAGYEVILKLTVDTRINQKTSVKVLVKADGFTVAQNIGENCSRIDPDLRNKISVFLGRSVSIGLRLR